MSMRKRHNYEAGDGNELRSRGFVDSVTLIMLVLGQEIILVMRNRKAAAKSYSGPIHITAIRRVNLNPASCITILYCTT